MKSMFATKTFWVNVLGVSLDLLALSELTTVIPPWTAPYISLALAVINIVLRRLRSEDASASFTAAGRQSASMMIALLLIPTLVLSACGLKGKARHSAVVVDTAVYTALATLQDGEMTMYKTCSAPSVPTALVKACADIVRNHADFNARLVPALKTGQQLNRVIRNWPADKPAPEELPRLVNEVRALTDALVANVPDSELKSKLLSYSFAASNAALQLLLMFAR